MTASTTDKIADCPSPDVSSTSSSRLGESTCHILPCKVEYEGMAKTHMFFKPVEIEDGVFAGSVRGRGLLAMRGSDDTDDKAVVSIHPILLSVEDNQIRPKAAITNFVEWHHEHSIKSLKYKEKESSRVPAAEEWIEVSKALHDPLPIED